MPTAQHPAGAGGEPTGAQRLPALDALPALRSALESPGLAVFVAPPGTGKTTGIPPALAGRPHGPDRRMVVVVPRRMAARAAAARMAAMSGETVGQTFGYSVRDDRRVGRRTVVEVVTPGLLLRRVQSDPALEGISTVLLDEFHERSLDQDLLLALLVELRGAIRQDLGLVVMSATLDVAPVRSLLGALTDDGGEVPLIEVSSPVHPIDTHWRPGSAHDRISDRVRDVVLEAMGDQEGDVLAFLPGRGEISATARGLRDRLGRTGSGRGARGAAAEVIELHGTSPAAVQEMVLEPRAAGPRRIVLATAVAETSITVPGVRVVVDSGLSRFQSFDPGTGLPALRTGSVSLSTAEQRRGRAGREAPGHCYRLWARRDEELMRAHDPPEITRADLAGLLLATSVWGAWSPSELQWLDPPPEAAVDAARVLLAELGALDDDGRPTAMGNRMAAFGFHPRMAAIATEATSLEVALGDESAGRVVELAARTMAVLDGPARTGVDLSEAVLTAAPEPRRSAVRGWQRRITRASGSNPPQPADVPEGPDEESLLSRLVVAGFPDRLARRRRERGDTYLLRHGGEVELPTGAGAGHLRGAEWLVVLDLDARTGSQGAGRIHLALGVAPGVVEGLLASAERRGLISEEVTHGWSPSDGSVWTTTTSRLGSITVASRRRRSVPASQLVRVVGEQIRGQGPQVLGSWEVLAELRSRIAFLGAVGAADHRWPDLSVEGVVSSIDSWLPVLVSSASVPARDQEVARFDPDPSQLEAVLLADLSHEDRRTMQRCAPTHWERPGGRHLRLRYGTDPADPTVVVLSVRLQELLGVDEHPMVGAVPVTVELLSPAGRPLQRTADLPGFWRGSYAAVRADMRGRYPKHDWPERPWESR